VTGGEVADGEVAGLDSTASAWEQQPILLAALDGEPLRVVAFNAVARRLLGHWYTIGSTVEDLDAGMPGTTLGDRLREVHRTGVAYSTREWRVPVPDDTGVPHEYYFDFTYAPWLGPGGGVRGVLVHAMDVTALVEARRAAEAASASWEQRYADSQAAMSTLQGALLPAEVPVLPGLQIGARYLLSDADTAAGGDWFDVVPLPDGRVALVVGDVVGHGVAASAVMSQLRTVLAERLADGAPMTDALAALDRCAARIRGAASSTVCVAVVDAASGQVDYCTAGHPPPLLVGAGGDWRYLGPSGAGPLGSGAPLPTATATLGLDDHLLLYTDGLVERPNRTLEQSTVEIGRVVADVVAGRPMLAGAATHPADRVCEQSLELLTRITGYGDDITVLAAHRVGAPADLRVRAAAQPDAVVSLAVELERWLAGADAGPDDQFALRHALVELVSNAVEHAYPPGSAGDISVAAGLGPDGWVTVTVADRGCWRDPDESVAAAHTAGDPRLRGLGLAMVRDLVDGFSLAHGSGGTLARLRRKLRRPAPLLAEPPGGGDHRPTRCADDDQLVIRTAGADRLAVAGALHLGTAASLSTRLGVESRGGTRALVVDLSGLTHLASAGVQLLRQARAAARDHGQDLVLIAPVGTVAHHVLELVAVRHDSAPPAAAGQSG
jgi:serine phosphatase RsbU (regulator of sigma subunit)/anti-sigma regulatory factor (Ser/Thr protein kinase)/anti-anti-sigma regulatory factor